MNCHSLVLPNQNSGIMQLLGPIQGCQKCDQGMLGEFGGLAGGYDLFPYAHSTLKGCDPCLSDTMFNECRVMSYLTDTQAN